MKLDMSNYKGNARALEVLKKINVTVKQQKFIKDCFTDYIIFSNKKKLGYCSKCKATFEGKFKHNETIKCPHCRTELMCKSEGMIDDYQRRYALMFQKKNAGTIAYVVEAWRNIPKYVLEYVIDGERPYIKGDLVAVYEFSDEYQAGYVNYYYGGWRKMTVPAGWPTPMQNNYVKVDKEGANYLMQKTRLKYVSDWIRSGTLTEVGNYPGELLKKLALVYKYPQLEFLYKMGFRRLLHEKLYKHKNYRAINWNAKNPLQVLRLSKQEFELIRGKDPSHQELAILQRANKEGTPIRTYDELQDIKKEVPFDAVSGLANVTTLRKLYNYRKKQTLQTYASIWWHDYLDYINMAKECGYDITDPYYLFPKNMTSAHDKLVEELNRKKRIAEKEADDKFTEDILKRCAGMAYESKGLLIRPAMNREEYDREGKCLHHCVATYYKKAREGRCTIFLIRKEEQPNMPYYTLELSPKMEMIQCRGERNCSMTDEVKAFVDKWLEHIKKKPKKEKEAA